MTKLTAGIVDYGVGNHTSVRQSIEKLGLRCRVSHDPSELDSCELVILPGVGAFQPAMRALKARGLDQYLTNRAECDKPILGICLGMQLLTDGSHEGGFATGLKLIPGETVPLGRLKWHIGWNTIDQVADDPMFRTVCDDAYFFNHAYSYQGPEQFQVCTTRLQQSFVSVIRRRSTVGVQFHPEKSQRAGQTLLKCIIDGLCNA